VLSPAPHAALAWALSGQSRTRALTKDVLFLVASFYLLKQDLTPPQVGRMPGIA
jgi:hypothetical protein